MCRDRVAPRMGDRGVIFAPKARERSIVTCEDETIDVSEVALAKNSLRSARRVVELRSFSRSTPLPYSATAHDWLWPDCPEATDAATSVDADDGIDGGGEPINERADSDLDRYEAKASLICSSVRLPICPLALPPFLFLPLPLPRPPSLLPRPPSPCPRPPLSGASFR